MVQNDDEEHSVTSATLLKREVNVEHATNQRLWKSLPNLVEDVGVKQDLKAIEDFPWILKVHHCSIDKNLQDQDKATWRDFQFGEGCFR